MSYQVGQTLSAVKVELRETQTEPPARFTDGTLIAAMTHIDRYVVNEADRRALRDAKGMGTERTRDSMIQTILDRKYIERTSGKGKRKELKPTALGMELIDKLPLNVRDPVTTAKWEMALSMIETGKMSPEAFDQAMRQATVKLVEEMQGIQFDLTKIGVKEGEPRKAAPEPDATLPGHGLKCPKCSKGTMMGKTLRSGKKVVSCSNYPACKNANWID